MKKNFIIKNKEYKSPYTIYRHFIPKINHINILKIQNENELELTTPFNVIFSNLSDKCKK